jgi:hypothetical protein
MVMEQQTKDKFLKPLIWQHYGNYHVFSYVKTICMVWEHQMREQQLILNIIPKEMLFLDLNVMLKIF